MPKYMPLIQCIMDISALKKRTGPANFADF